MLKKIMSKATTRIPDNRALTTTDPFRLQGSGVDFKCKMIGVRDLPRFSTTNGNGTPLEVLSFEQMLLAKDCAAHSGFRKRKLILNVSLGGLKISDALYGTELHCFPASSIPFLQLDKRDSRAFSFVVSSPVGHQLYAIKSAEQAEQVLRAINQMFHVVFEMEGGRIDSGVPVVDLLDFADGVRSDAQRALPDPTDVPPSPKLDSFIDFLKRAGDDDERRAE